MQYFNTQATKKDWYIRCKITVLFQGPSRQLHVQS